MFYLLQIDPRKCTSRGGHGIFLGENVKLERKWGTSNEIFDERCYFRPEGSLLDLLLFGFRLSASSSVFVSLMILIIDLKNVWNPGCLGIIRLANLAWNDSA